MGLLTCCVGGCTATSETHRLYRIPQNDNLRALWMTFLVLTNPRLAGLTKNQVIHKRVCSKHFDKHQFNAEGQRNRYSYPCLFSDLEIALGEPRSTMGWNILNEHNYFQKHTDVEPVLNIDTAAEIDKGQPSCSYTTTDEDITISIIKGKAETDEVRASCSFAKPGEIITISIMKRKGWNILNEHNYFQKHTDVEPVLNIDTAAETDEVRASCSFAKPGEIITISIMKGKEWNILNEHNYFQKHTDVEPVLNIDTAGLDKRKPISKKRKFVKQIIKISAENVGNTPIQNIQKAQHISGTAIFEKFCSLPKQARTFVEMQLKHVDKKKMARRFTLNEKLMALALIKQSPKGYKLLEKMFTLPSKRTLSRVSENINFDPGHNPHIFEHITNTIKNWNEKKKLCSILYDEVALTPHITYDENKDDIIGFVNINRQKKMAYCDHALVFMVRGICASWRQCIAYHFVQGTVSAVELKLILKDVVVQVAQTGLIPIALVSDQGSTFRTTIRNLRNESIQSRTEGGLRDDGTVDIAGFQLNVVFDPPHLLKSVRNNFMTKDVLWERKTASWKDIQYVYDIDSKLGHTRALPKLSSYHVDPQKIKKMKVSVAAQVLSARTAALLKYTDAIRQTPRSSTMAATAEFVEFVDNLFDSVNGRPGGGKKGKLRKAIKRDSSHAEFWTSAIQILKKIKFVDSKSKFALKNGQPRHIRVPCLDGWITTLESFIRISQVMFEKYNVEFFYPRYINQDPLENFFGRLRALNYRNINPDANTFMYSFKSLMLSNILSPHSRFSNCESDEGDSLIDMSIMLSESKKHDDIYDEDVKENVSPNTEYAVISTPPSRNSPSDLMGQVISEKIRVHCSAYTAGYICRKITKTINCKQCTKSYTSGNIENIHMYIQYREYKNLRNRNLAYPNENFLRLYRDSASVIHNYLNINCHKNNIKSQLKNILVEKCTFLSIIGCSHHHNEKVKNLFLNIVIRLQVHNWCKIINKILKGSIEEKYVMKMNEPQKMALSKYKTFRLRKKCISK